MWLSICDSFSPCSLLIIKINEKVGYTPTLHTYPTPLEAALGGLLFSRASEENVSMVWKQRIACVNGETCWWTQILWATNYELCFIRQMGQNYPIAPSNHSKSQQKNFGLFSPLYCQVLCKASFFFFNFILFFHIDITRLYKPVLKISINWGLWGRPGKKPIIKCHGDKQTSLEKDLQMRCYYKISKKEKVHSKYYQKHLNLVSTFSTSGINFFFFLYSFVMYSSSKSHYGAKRRNEQQQSDVEKKAKHEEFKKGEKRQLQRNNRNMLYTSVESTHTNTSPARSK